MVQQSELHTLNQEAKAAAVARIAEIFAHPDDLHSNFTSYRKKIISERSLIEAQLKTALESQLQDANRGLDILGNSQQESQIIKMNLQSIQSLLNDAHHSIDNYSKIMQISKTHQNFVATRDMVNQFQALNAQVNRTKHFLSIESTKIVSDHPHLLPIHYQITQLQNFKSTTLMHVKDSSSDVMSTLQNYFRRIDKLSDEFEVYFWKLAKATLPLIKEDFTSVIVRIVKIIENEEKADDEWANSELLSVNKNEPSSIESVMKERKIKSYRIKYFDVVRESIVEDFNELYRINKDNMMEFLNSVDVVINDLVLVYDELVPRFPKRYNIFQFFVLEYHRITYDILNRIVKGSMEGVNILSLLKWTRGYYDNMSGRLGVGEELLEPKLLDGKESELIKQYIKTVKIKLSEWLKALVEKETSEFIRREFCPDTDAEGLYILSGSIIIFKMFNQQIDVVSSSSKGSLLNDVVSECISMFEEYQKFWSDLLDEEFKKFQTKPTESEAGLPEFIIALANDCYRSTEFSENAIAKLEASSDEPYTQQMTLKINSVSDGFLKLSKKAYTLLIDIILHDCRPAFIQMHCPQWYEQDIMRLIVGTLEDYSRDYQQHLTGHLFTKLVTDLIDKFVILYLESMRNKQAKFKMPNAAERMRDDLKKCTDFFSTIKTAKRVITSFDAIEKVIIFVEANPRLAFVEFYNLWKNYQDIPYLYIEELVNRRDDLEKGESKELLESAREKIKEGTKDGIAPNATVFSKVFMGKMK